MANKLSQQEYNKRKQKLDEGYGWCSKCQEFKPLIEFAKSKTTMFGHYNWCRKCHSKLRKGNEKIQKLLRDRARFLTKYYIDLAGGCCQKCGYSRSWFALDFHHINPDEKKFNLSNCIITNNNEKIIAEIDKCILLCSNCHREFHGGLWEAEFIKQNNLGWTIKSETITKIELDNNYENLPDKFKYSQTKF